MRSWIANLISISRLALMAPWALDQRMGGKSALPYMCAIAATDLLDGRAARWLGTSSALGARIDSGCDFAVLSIAALILAIDEPRYLFVALSMVAAFGSWKYVHRRAGRPVYTRLGKYDGALLYALALFGSSGAWFDSGIAAAARGAEPWLIAGTALYLSASAAENLGRLSAERRPAPKARAGRSRRNRIAQAPTLPV